MTFIWTYILPEAGKYIPKLDDLKSDHNYIERQIILEDDDITEPRMFAEIPNPIILAELHDEKVNNLYRPMRARIATDFPRKLMFQFSNSTPFFEVSKLDGSRTPISLGLNEKHQTEGSQN